uniref:Ribosome maturation factor RimM n=1 Tax=Candidatus Aschnera chinzeii TaxID=1485666 RepID=A0AAT9G5A6_9ENTR|nr:MAG: ribosome maturation factor RimM [Candidatus Aschnera chinzeii]
MYVFNHKINNPIIIGKIKSAYGIYGYLKIHSFTEKSKNILLYQPWYIKNNTIWKMLHIEKQQLIRKNIILVKLKKINNRNDALAITNHDIIIDISQLPNLNNNQYYWSQLIGYKVKNTKNYNFGYIYDFIRTKSNDVLIVKKNHQDIFDIQQRLIPFIENSVIKKIDNTKKIIEVDWNPKF